MSATSVRYASASAGRLTPSERFLFPPSSRLRKKPEFDKVYEQGTKSACAFFSVLFRYDDSRATPRVGFTTPRRLGNAVVRNRLRRRLREAVRLELAAVERGWEFVFQPRPAAADAPFGNLRDEVAKVFRRCKTPSS